MATIVDTNVVPPRVLESVDVLDYLDPAHVQTDGKGKRWHMLDKHTVVGKLKPGLLYNPDLSQVRDANGRAKLPARYWKPSGNALVPMTQPERDAVDLALNPPDPEREAVQAILAKPDAEITAAERNRVLLRMARKQLAQGNL